MKGTKLKCFHLPTNDHHISLDTLVTGHKIQAIWGIEKPVSYSVGSVIDLCDLTWDSCYGKENGPVKV